MVSILERMGVVLKPSGARTYSGLCPLHKDTLPSFYVYKDSDKDRFKCFGCNLHGDIIGFYMAYYGCDVVGAINKLGIKQEMPTRNKARYLKRQDKLVDEFGKWKMAMISGLRHLIELCREAMEDNFIPETIHEAGLILESISALNLRLEIMLSGDEDGILNIYQKHRMLPVCDFARMDFERRAYGR